MSLTQTKTNSNKIVAGIDASKDTLEISINGGETSTIKNAASPIKRFIKRLLTTHPNINMVVFEPTGGYERKLASLLAEAEIPYRRCHPNFAHNFIRSYSVRAKTDALNAKMLALYGLSRDLESTTPIDPIVKDARCWMTMDRQLVKMTTQLTNRLHLLEGEPTEAATKKLRDTLKEERKAAEREALALIKEKPDLYKRFRLLKSIPGFGDLISAYLVLLCRSWASGAAVRSVPCLVWLLGRTRAASRQVGAAFGAVGAIFGRFCICRRCRRFVSTRT